MARFPNPHTGSIGSFWRWARCALLLAALPAGLTAQTASYSQFGASCGSFLPPTLSAIGVPRLGGTMTLVYQGSIDSSFVGNTVTSHQPLLLTGTSRTRHGSIPLPLGLPLALTRQTAGCSVYVSPDIMTPLVRDPRLVNETRLPLAIPNVPALLGVEFFQQVLLYTRQTTGQTLAWERLWTSNGTHARIGL